MITENRLRVLDLPEVRNPRIQNPDSEKLKEAIRVFRDSVPDKGHPTSTILPLILPRRWSSMIDQLPKTNGLEFLA